MNVSVHTLRRLVSVTGLAAAVAALAVPTAVARYADVDGSTMSRTQVVLDVRSPDTLDATAQAPDSGLDPAIATAMAAHERVLVPGDLRSPDRRDVGTNPVQGPPTVAAPVTSNGFDWSRFAIGLAAIGAMLVGVGGLALLSHGKHTRSVTAA